MSRQPAAERRLHNKLAIHARWHHDVAGLRAEYREAVAARRLHEAAASLIAVRTAQGLSVTVEDPTVLAAIVAVVLSHNPIGANLDTNGPPGEGGPFQEPLHDPATPTRKL